MKNLIIAIVTLLLLFSCNIDKQKINKGLNVGSLKDTIFVDTTQTKPELVLSKFEYDIINSFRPALRDAAIYMKLNQDKFSLDTYHFKCGKYKFWIANGSNYFRVESPIEVSLKEEEKKYFWKIFTYYRDNKYRTYKYENDIEIVVK